MNKPFHKCHTKTTYLIRPLKFECQNHFYDTHTLRSPTMSVRTAHRLQMSRNVNNWDGKEINCQNIFSRKKKPLQLLGLQSAQTSNYPCNVQVFIIWRFDHYRCS